AVGTQDVETLLHAAARTPPAGAAQHAEVQGTVGGLEDAVDAGAGEVLDEGQDDPLQLAADILDEDAHDLVRLAVHQVGNQDLALVAAVAQHDGITPRPAGEVVRGVAGRAADLPGAPDHRRGFGDGAPHGV